MNSKEEIGFDPLIWTPDILSMLIKREKAKGRLKSIINSWQKYENIVDIEPIKFIHEVESRRLGRQAKPNDWLIYKRDQVIVQLAEYWMAADKTRTSLDFCTDIFPLVVSYHFQSEEEQSISGFPQIKFVEDGKVIESSTTLVCGLLWCLDSMQSLETGEVEETVIALMKASLCLSGCLSAIEHVLFPQPESADPISAAISAFSRSGTDAKHAGVRALKIQALAHYTEHGHGYKSKEAAAAAIAEKFGGVSDRTVNKWLSGVTPMNSKPGALPK